MNYLEKRLVEIGKSLRQDFGAVGVKAEFEAEATHPDELKRLVDIAHCADLKLAIKVGGCEARRDIAEARQFGADFVIAPMIETQYALDKFQGAIRAEFAPESIETKKFLINIETFSSFGELPGMLTRLAVPSAPVSGIVFGRSDYCGSIGVSKDDINSPHIMQVVEEAAQMTRKAGLEFVVGGGVSPDSINPLRAVSEILLSRFETRKVVFDGDSIDLKEISQGLTAAIKFELIWLEAKMSFYSNLVAEDRQRIDTLNARWGLTD